MLIPQPEKPAANNQTVLGQLTPAVSSSLSGPPTSAGSESDSLVLLGLQKDAEREGKGLDQLAHKAPGAWLGTSFAVLALILAIAAMPAAVLHHPLLGAELAALGVLLGAFGLFIAFTRRGAGCGLSLAGTAICGSILFVALFLLVKDSATNDPQAQTDAAKQNESDAGTGAKEGAREPNKEASQKETPRTDREGSKGDAPKRRTQRHEEEESPADRTPRRTPPPKTELDRLIEQLKTEKTDDRVAAAERLRKMGEKARPAARALCEAIVSSSEPLRRAALEALEKVDPTLYKQVVLLVVDENAYNHVQASNALAAMGAEGAAAVPVLLAHAKKVSATNYLNESMLIADIAALAKLGAGESAVVELFKELTKFQKANRGGWQVRPAAINALVAAGKAQPTRRKELVPVLVAATAESPDIFGRHDEATCLAAIKALGEFGPDAKAAVPRLKDLKLSSSMMIRDGARAALEKIEKDAEE
jgi:hypothetical protein